MGAFSRFRRTDIISSILHRLFYALQYMFSERSRYFFHFPRITIRYHQIFEERSILKLKKKQKKLMVTKRNVLEN